MYASTTSYASVNRPRKTSLTGLEHSMEESAHHHNRELANMSREELLSVRSRNVALLSDLSLLKTLPDKGEKLKKSIDHIDALLSSYSIPSQMPNSAERNYRESEGIRSTSTGSSYLDARRRSIEQANAQAREYMLTNTLLAAKRTSIAGNVDQHPSRTRMMGLDESVKLQQDQRQKIKEDTIRGEQEMRQQQPKHRVSESLADALSITQEGMKLDPECQQPPPQDDDDQNPDDDLTDQQETMDLVSADTSFDIDDEDIDDEYMDRRP